MRVVGPTGAVAGASVCATRTGGEPRCGASGTDGGATLELPTGTYAVRAVPGAGQRLAEGVATVDLSEGGATSVQVTLEGRGTISGTVRDEGATTVRGAEVCAHGPTADEVACARTRGDGTYTVEVRPGIHKLAVAGPPDGSRLVGQWARGRASSDEADLIDTRTHDVTGVDVVLVRGVTLSGVVSTARDGATVTDAQVCTYPFAAPLGWDCERTDKRGRYALLREPGRYWVWVIPPGDRGSRLVYQRYDRVLEGVDARPFLLFKDATLDVALGEGTVLRGRVTTPDGAPVVLARVCLDTPFPTGRICRTTADDGTYEVATRPETYVVQVLPAAGSDLIAGFWPDAQPDWTKAGEVRVGRADLRLDLVVPRGIRLSGVVRNGRGAPVEGATISVSDGGGPRYFGSTDVLGRYSVAVRPGTLTVDVFAPLVGDLVSVVGQQLAVGGETRYEVVLPDARPE